MERIYFDGECGFCTGWAAWIARREPPGGLFRFAPLKGTTFATRVPPERRAGLTGTVVVETADGRLLARSEAVIHVLRRIGRRRTAALLALWPRPIRDLGYLLFARSLRRDSCPAPERSLRERLDP